MGAALTFRPVVTISSAYGAGGGFIGPEVAKRLGVTFVDRLISTEVAADLHQGIDTVEGFEDELGQRASHWLALFSNLTGPWGSVPPLDPSWSHDEESYRSHVDDVLHRMAKCGAVILGRGSQFVLRDVAGTLHVRLDGPAERRIAQAVEFGGIEEQAARHAQHHTDAARHRYFRRLYHGEVADPRYYHLVIDATAVPWATCVDIIVATIQGQAALRRLDGWIGDTARE